MDNELSTKLLEIEASLARFIPEQKARLLIVEQALTAPNKGGTYTESKAIAPRDAMSGMPILSKSHKFVDNMPAGFEKKGLDIGRLLKGMVTGNWTGAAEEKKSMSETSGPAGQYTLPLEISAMWIDFARAASVCVAAGANSLPLTSSTLRVPVLASDIVCSWKQELDTVPDVSPVLDKVDATAHTLAGELLVSMELFEDSAMVGDIITSAFTRSMGQQLDQAALNGAATYGPLGLTGNSAVASFAGTAEAATYDEISLAIQDVRQRNYTPNAYIVSPKGAGGLDRLRAVPTGNYLRPPDDVAALSRHVTSAALDDVFVGDFTKLFFFPRTAIHIELSREAPGAWDKLGIAIRAYLRSDCAAVAPRAFEIISSFGS
jgi:HK97 family phage major capsid protein